MMEQRGSAATKLSWAGLLVTSFLAAFLYVVLEWLFAATKPSFMNGFPMGRQVEILLFNGALAGAAGAMVVAALALVSAIPGFGKVRPVLLRLAGVISSIVLAAAALLLIDNFTYTLFKFGIVDAEGVVRGVYGAGFIGLTVLLYLWVVMPAARWFSRRLRRPAARRTVATVLGGLALVALAMPFLLDEPAYDPAGLAVSQPAEKRPNILLLTSDGVNATSMSVYGYERETTPNLTSLADSMLVGENHFTNAGNTAGSVVSMLTGKYPATTRVLYPPDILRGESAYQHLPGILKSQGYATVQISAPHYVDAYTMNLIEGFDEANNHAMTPQTSLLTRMSRILPNEYPYFLYEVSNRIGDRLRHIFFLKKMSNPFVAITDPDEAVNDLLKQEQLIELIKTTEQPLFVHVHYLGTHGATFRPKMPYFSKGKDVATQEKWDPDFYDDSIRDFDRYIGEVMQTLADTGKLDDTILIIGSDHGQRFSAVRRIPLFIRFPNGEHAGRIQANTQNLDIAPTILDYVGMEIPAWMEGQSLLAGEIPQRAIVSVAVGSVISEQETTFWEIDPEESRAPFYQFGNVNVISCGGWFRLNLAEKEWASGRVIDYQGRCSGRASAEQALGVMVDHLRTHAFDTRSISDAKAILASARAD